ncbi:MAG TPA: DUF427 domain-containing protein [Solirubrobacteraceae bacterium]|jgi:uncharacterized protein (DUF427 family)|nr:DUF427 domain-containing protein [Solirubrobacteraceae bacterium]
MSLTLGTAPFSPHPAGEWNFEYDGPAHALYLHPQPRRLRAEFAGVTVLDTLRPQLLHETALLPRYYVPREDVHWELFEPTDHATHCPFKGDARYWTLRVGARTAENVVWNYPEPIEGAPGFSELVSFYWEPLDHWYEEDEEVFVHPRDPFHRVDVLPASRRVRVSLDGVELAATGRAQALHESGLPVRWYIPREDVRFDNLREAGDLQTRCPYKGVTSGYWSAGDEEAVAWTYDDPLAAVAPIARHIAFFGERVDIEVDGAAEERGPATQWSKKDWIERARRAA